MTLEISRLNFQSPTDVNKFFEGWRNLSELERINVIKELKDSGSIAFVGGNRPQKFKCPIHQFQVAVPCALKSCQYFIEHSDSKNCVINCLEGAKNKRLLSQDISGLLNTPISSVNQSIDSATKKIQVALIKDQIDNFEIVRFKFLAGHCVACGMHIEDELALNPDMVIDGHYGWCSTECKSATPRWIFKLEKMFECAIIDILAISYTAIHKLESIDQLFKLPTGTSRTYWDQIRKRLDYLE